MRLIERSDLSARFKEYLATRSLLSQVAEAVKSDFEQSGLAAHNWEHIYRDALNAIVIGEAEGADMSIVMPAILMHDIGFLYRATGKTHWAVGADKLPEFLSKHAIDYDDATIELMAECIRTHKGSTHNEKPVSLEAKVVSDADLLEKSGSFGIYQTIKTWAEFNYPIEKILLRIHTDNFELITGTGKKLAEPGWSYMKQFFKELDEANEPYRDKD